MKKRAGGIKTFYIVLLAIIIIFAGIQLIPVNRSNPAVIKEPTWATTETRDLARKACFDCHSNETKWPAYSFIAPFSWFVAGHVNEGRSKLNFSEWKAKDTDEIIEEVTEGKMPLKSYLLLHSDARLTETEKEKLINGFQLMFRMEGSSADKQNEESEPEY